VFDEGFGSAAGEWALLLPRPPFPGDLGAVAVAAPGEHVPVAVQQRPRGDELVGVPVAGEAEPCGAAVCGVPQPGHNGLRLAGRRAEQTPVDDPAAPRCCYMECRHLSSPRVPTTGPRGSATELLPLDPGRFLSLREPGRVRDQDTIGVSQVLDRP
jgi:hypothetical protein